MSSFSLASVCGVPLGLVLASHLSWHVPFYVLGVLSLLILTFAARVLPVLRGHLQHATDEHPISRMITILRHKDHVMAFVFMAVLTLTGFLIFPYISNYMVANVGLTEDELPLIYLAGGGCTIFSLNWIGRWADRRGKHYVFRVVSFVALIPIALLTNLPHVPLPLAILVSTIFMICMSGRSVPAMAMMTGSIEARYRGGFMSINSSIQQFSAGVASMISGHVLGQTADGRITNFWVVGIISLVCALACIYLARFLKTPVDPRAVSEPSFVEL
ncbi:MAG: MFS transporter [Bdellovibrionota bacterium]